MNIFIEGFNLLLYQPILNALILLYEYLPGKDFGVAIIVLTLLIRFLLYPFSRQAIASQKAMADLQPKIKEIQEKFKKDREKQARAMMALYQKEKINPFSGCLPYLVQIPILIALYRVFWRGLEKSQAVFLYSFVPNPFDGFEPTFLGLINLGKASAFLAVIAAILQFWQTKMLSPQNSKKKEKKEAKKSNKPDFGAMFQKQMLYFFPFFTFLILLKFPSAIALYWITTSLFSIGQQYMFLKEKKS